MAQVELGASKSDASAAVCCMLDPELQYQGEDDTRSLRKAAAGQTLALSAGTELQVSEDTLSCQRSATLSPALLLD